MNYMEKAPRSAQQPLADATACNHIPAPLSRSISFPAGSGAGSGSTRVLLATKPRWKHPHWAAGFSSREDTSTGLGYFSWKGQLGS